MIILKIIDVSTTFIFSKEAEYVWNYSIFARILTIQEKIKF